MYALYHGLFPTTITTLTLEHTEVYLFKDTFTFLRGKKKDVGDRNSNEFSAHTNWDPEFQFGSTGRAPRVYGLNRGSGLKDAHYSTGLRYSHSFPFSPVTM